MMEMPFKRASKEQLYLEAEGDPRRFWGTGGIPSLSDDWAKLASLLPFSRARRRVRAQRAGQVEVLDKCCCVEKDGSLH